MLSRIFGNRNKTLKPLKAHGDTKKSELSQYAKTEYAKATLGSGDMRAAVILPRNEDLNEWLAVNTVDFFNEISLLYGTVTDFCTPQTCPIMSAEGYEYHWMDGVKYKKPVQVSAPEYVDLLMTWVETQLNDEQIFPLQVGTPFPKDFLSRVKVIFKRLFRIYAHVYSSHFNSIVELGAEAHLNTCFKHFIYFVQEFDLVESSDLNVLKTHIDSLLGKDEDKK